jgi:hypothetical protein
MRTGPNRNTLKSQYHVHYIGFPDRYVMFCVVSLFGVYPVSRWDAWIGASRLRKCTDAEEASLHVKLWRERLSKSSGSGLCRRAEAAVFVVLTCAQRRARRRRGSWMCRGACGLCW